VQIDLIEAIQVTTCFKWCWRYSNHAWAALRQSWLCIWLL